MAEGRALTLPAETVAASASSATKVVLKIMVLLALSPERASERASEVSEVSGWAQGMDGLRWGLIILES
jgi:hypothetical protein